MARASPAPARRLAPPDARRWGALLLALLAILALPGFALALQYEPDPARAHDAVAAADAGPLRQARGAHAWAASLALGLALVHAAGAYASGRLHTAGRRAALAGLASVAVLAGAFLTGTILPWDQQGFEAYRHLQDGAALVGAQIGAREPDDAPLRALFLLHVLLVPALLVGLLAVHLRRGRIRADLARVGRLVREGWKPLLALFLGVQLLAWLLPPTLGPAPLANLALTQPDWPFRWLVPLQDVAGDVALLALPLAFLAAGAAILARSPASARIRRALVLAAATTGLVLSLLLVPAASAHGDEAHLDDQLVAEGEALLLGSFTAPQPGALLVVPFVDGPLGCAPPPSAEYRILLDRNATGGPLATGSGESAVGFATNTTALAAYFDVPPAGGGYLALAVDTHDATRALILMQESAIALHALVGVVSRSGSLDVETGALGLPYPLAGAPAHDMGPFTPEGGGIVMDHDGSFRGGAACAGEARGHLAITYAFDELPDSLGPGKLVHAVAMHDPRIEQFPPRPIDASTRVLQANLYLARPGEDPARVREALDPSLGLSDGLPLLLLALGVVWVSRR